MSTSFQEVKGCYHFHSTWGGGRPYCTVTGNRSSFEDAGGGDAKHGHRQVAGDGNY